jgi:hypothetical protein
MLMRLSQVENKRKLLVLSCEMSLRGASFIATRSCGIPNVDDATTAEAYAPWDDHLLAGRIGWPRLIVQSNCLVVVEIMNAGGNSIGVASIYEECTFLCRGFFNVKFYHCRAGMEVARRWRSTGRGGRRDTMCRGKGMAEKISEKEKRCGILSTGEERPDFSCQFTILNYFLGL